MSEERGPRVGRASRESEAVVQAIPLRRRLAYVALLLGLALVLAEGVMRIVFAVQGDLPPTPDASLIYEWKWARAKLAAGRAESVDPRLIRFDADLGWRLRERYDRDGFRVNAQGLRADREFESGPVAGRARLALLGDSFTFGDHVANHQTFAHFLEHESFERVDVLNFAVNGFGTDQALLAYEFHGERFAADVVVMGFYVGDYERNRQRFKTYAKPYFDVEDGALVLRNHPVPSPDELYQAYASGRRRVGEVSRPYLWLSIQKARQRWRERNPSSEDPEWRVLAALMKRFRDHVLGQGARPVWMILPSRDVMTADRSHNAAIEEMAETHARALGMPVLRIDAALRAAGDDPPLYRPRRIGGHFSEAGHRVVAATLARFLTEEVGFPPLFPATPDS